MKELTAFLMIIIGIFIYIHFLRNNLLKYNYYELTKIYDKIKKLKSKYDVFYHLKVNGVRNW